MTEPAVLPELDLCGVCDKPIPEGEVNDCDMLGSVHSGCNTQANGCRDPLCDPAWEGN